MSQAQMLGVLLLRMLPHLVMTMKMTTEIMHLALMWHQESNRSSLENMSSAA